MFWTGYTATAMPTEYAQVPRLQKPSSAEDAVRALLRDICVAPPAQVPVLADLYFADDGAHLLVLRAGRDPLSDPALVWVGAAFLDATEWGRRLRVPLVPGVPVRVPWRYLAWLRHQLAMMG